MTPARHPFWHTVWSALLIAAVVLLTRGAMIATHQSPRYDDEFHLDRGISFLRKDLGSRRVNDPPFGGAVGALPLFVTGSYNASPSVDMGLYGHRLSPETLLMLVALWKSALFLPLVAVVFLWTRELYGVAAAWVAIAALLIEPTFAAHTPIASVDVLGVEGIVIACFALWKYFQRPAIGRLLLVCLAIATALMLKHTALILPGVAGLFAAIWWGAKPWLDGETLVAWRGHLRQRVGHALLAIPVGLMCLWSLSLFDVSVPLRKKDSDTYANKTLRELMRTPMPNGVYLRSFETGVVHASEGHPNFFEGVKGRLGTWRYFPTLATYKLPVGELALLAVGVASLAWRRPRFDELSLALPAVAWSALMIHSELNIGFRHFLPPLAFLLMLASRAVADGARLRLRTIIAGACCAVAFGETLRFHPNYLPFTNGLRGEPWLVFSDSNLDWGQSLPALRKWADARKDDRPIAFAYFGWEVPTALDHYLGGSKVKVVMRPPYGDQQPGALPTRGLFVVSPVALAGVYDREDRLKPLWKLKPIEVIDGCLLVYDLDAQPIEWPRVKQGRRKDPSDRTAWSTSQPAD